MKRKGKKFQKKGQSSLNKLSLFQKNEGRFNKSCPFSVKNAPVIDYKNINLLKKYISENNKILSSKITAVSSGKQKKLTREINNNNFDIVEVHNRPLLLFKLINKIKSRFIFYFHNDPLSMKGSKTIKERLRLLYEYKKKS